MDTAGYLASIFIGIALGLIGGGGSILTVPVLVYLFNLDVVLATAYSLFVVGTTSIVGSFSFFKKGLINIKTAIVFGIPSIISVFLTRAYIVPAIPQEVFSIGNFTVTKNMLLMLLFAVLMIFTSYSMIKKEKDVTDEAPQKQQFNYPLILMEGILVGILTGLVGAGGGFLIIPALVLLSKLPMKEAVGTSLVIIAAKSLIGFFGESGETVIDWVFLSKVTVFAIIGIFTGMGLSKRINGDKLKPAFGWFVLVMGIYIVLKETVIR
ncbi:sulfite exporter TauE/SafE family protein [Parapusillimonas sp. SGNA-6]|uniref:sulfite exporter TauE/SafE family protein n=1 Tax=Parapedobacter sp. SGR-10 TaxID=2710879 RepID=UPI0013D42D76|nr:sulfite exporter TauE/SafE family protein [Parapedobacter sp. SGR-10]NGF57790.1 sulfite exporter TauE/SafE family protein [Parapedobacter sp. SGR-10]NGM89686.1 sulfite exporter TauE/SafE family protein [Parapusillimonas sp. SGNA-6]